MKPILFNTAMVRAILDGRKTVTRRAVKPRRGGHLEVHDDLFGTPCLSERCGSLCRGLKPPFQSGDILYVRETFFRFDGGGYAYKADGNYESEKLVRELGYKWRPSIHMPLKAARIFLRVTDVRVERLKNMTNYDLVNDFGLAIEAIVAVGWDTLGSLVWNETIDFKDLTTYGWDANPWVWVIEFDRISKEEAEDKPDEKD